MAVILIVDDESVIRVFLKRLFSLKGHTVCLAKDGDEAADFAREHDFQIALIELRLYRQYDGVEVFRMLKRLRPQATYIIMTGGTGEQDVRDVLSKEGALHCFKKPFDIPALLAHVETILNPETAP